LNSPSSKSCKICPKRRSVQSQAKNLIVPLDEYMLASVVNLTFLYSIRVIENQTMYAMKKPSVPSVVVVVVLLAVAVIAEAQQPKKVARICYLGNAISGRQAAYVKTLRERLRELGHLEGQNITIEYRDFEGKVERLPGLAAELVGRNCDVIVTQGNEAAEAAKSATKTIPIVMAFGADAVKLGIVADLAPPGWKHHGANLHRF
jgi:ABC-type uncharacterized transport system substrate-binding protein